MILKPKSTVHNPRMLVYRRFTVIDSSYSLRTLYKTTDDKMWTFNSQTLNFNEVSSELVPTGATIINVPQGTILDYMSKYFSYGANGWEQLNSLPQNITLLSAQFNNIGKYQTNKYYYVGSMDYMIKGSIEGTTTQQIKGNIIPLTSMNIKFFNDSIKVSVGDLVVIDKHLFIVENVETVQKRLPRVFNIYFATLNNIL